MTHTLALETSCDDTAVAILKHTSLTKHEVLAHVSASQYATHTPYGGVVPSLAARDHATNLPLLFKTLFDQVPDFRYSNLDQIAYTAGPGLAPCLLVGKTAAQMLALVFNKPLVPVDHLKAHLASALLDSSLGGHGYPLPAVALVVSGGHTSLYSVETYTNASLIGQTRDDAAGEAFDKVARLLDLPLPGGPALEKLAQGGDATAFKFPRPLSNDPSLDFSFSGLKTSVLYKIRDLGFKAQGLKADIAASFQQAVIDSLSSKVKLAFTTLSPKSFLLVGGVAANKALRHTLSEITKDANATFICPPFEYCTDNAVMIGVMGYLISQGE